MKKSELRQIIREEIEKLAEAGSFGHKIKTTIRKINPLEKPYLQHKSNQEWDKAKQHLGKDDAKNSVRSMRSSKRYNWLARGRKPFSSGPSKG